MDWMLMPLRRYAEFSGRSRRKEYWMFALLNVLIALFVGLVTLVMAVSVSSESAMMVVVTPVLILWFLLSLVFIIPGLAVTIRRLHDIDKSGWTILLALIPLVGPIVLLVFYCTEGTPGPNRFGPDPKAGELGNPVTA